jgi:hypothetical protein
LLELGPEVAIVAQLGDDQRTDANRHAPDHCTMVRVRSAT